MRYSLILPAAYCVLAALAWIDFVRLPPDGLANLGLMLVVLPVTLADLAIRAAVGSERSVLMPAGLGYYTAHAIFFGLSAALIALLLFFLGRGLDRRGRHGAGS